MTYTGFSTAIKQLNNFSGYGADTKIRIRTKTGNEILSPDTRSIKQMQDCVVINCNDFCTVLDYDSIESLHAETKDIEQMRYINSNKIELLENAKVTRFDLLS